MTLKTENELYEIYKKHKSLRNHKKAKYFIEKITKINKKNPKYYINLGQANVDIKDNIGALNAYKHAIEIQNKKSIFEIKKEIGKRLNNSKIISEYKILGGRFNMGMIEHKTADQCYITKISNTNNRSKKEKEIYTKIIEKFPNLKKITPMLIDLYETNNTQYLTLEKIDTINVKPDFKSVIELSNKISQIKYKDIIKSYSYKIKKTPSITARSHSAFKFSALLHKKHCNENLLQQLNNISITRQYNDQEMKVIEKLKNIIISNDLYNKLIPEKYYSLNHGDFKNQNLGYRQNNKLLAYDWESFLIGPKFADIAFYSFFHKINIEKVLNMYVDKKNAYLDSIERVYFIILLIIFYYIDQGNRKIETREKRLKNIITPLLEYLENEIKVN